MAEPIPGGDRSPATPPPDTAAPFLRIQLLGAFQVMRGSQVIAEQAWPLRKARSLVKLLALAPGHRLPREQVQEWLWPDLAAAAAANNLRKALHIARRALDPLGTVGPLLHLQGEMLRLAPSSPLWIDTEAFTAAAAQARQTQQRPAYQAALALYTGDLLPDDPYEEWVLRPRTALRAMYVALLIELARLEQGQEAWEPAIAALHQALAQDPLHEEAHTGLMRLYALTGQRPQALRQYQQFQEQLRRELDVEPSAESQALYQAIVAGHFPAPAAVPSPPARRHNLPTPLTRFIGRERAVQEVGELLTRTRLLTLTGAGGCGKTRLALEVAGQAIPTFPDGGWWVELAPLADPALVPQELAATLGIREEPGQPLPTTLREWLQDKQLLLVLDNCEHLITACAHLAERLLQGCPALTILATSREALNIAGENAWVVPSLSIPDPSALVTPGGDPVAMLLHYEASRLFADRAEAALPGFRLTPAIAPAVAQICRRLDGIPLALELAAARIKVLSAEQMAERLEHSFRFLSAGSRTALPRHQTLSAALDWSHDLLAPAERALFRRLAVFAGGFTLEAAEHIGAATDLAAGAVLNLLAHLLDKSLVLAEAPVEGAPVRYRLLEPLRHYGQERLAESGEAAATARRHAAYYGTLAEQADAELRGPAQVGWLERLDQEYDNLRAALAWCRDQDTALGLPLAVHLGQFWDARGYTTEGTVWLLSLLPAAPRQTLTHAWALFWAGFLSSRQGDNITPIPLLEESLYIFRAAGDRAGVAAALERLGLTVALQGDYVTGKQLLEESLAGFRALSDKAGMGWTLATLGMLARTEDAYARTRALLEESQGYLRAIGDRRNLAFTLNNLGQLARVEGDYGRARALLAESLVLAREAGDRHYIGWTLQCLGDVARRQGDHVQAGAWLAEAIMLLGRIHSDRHIAQCLCFFAALRTAQGAYALAIRLVGAALALQEHLRASLDADERADLDATIATARTALGAEAFARAWAEGQALTAEQAAAAALAPLPPPA